MLDGMTDELTCLIISDELIREEVDYDDYRLTFW